MGSITHTRFTSSISAVRERLKAGLVCSVQRSVQSHCKNSTPCSQLTDHRRLITLDTLVLDKDIPTSPRLAKDHHRMHTHKIPAYVLSYPKQMQLVMEGDRGRNMVRYFSAG